MSDGYLDIGVKYDDGKPQMDLLPASALVSVSEVLGYGAKKYGRFNYLKGMNWSRLIAAAMRHLFAFSSGENKDKESGLPHLAHAACCLLFLLEYANKGIGSDDRPKA